MNRFLGRLTTRRLAFVVAVVGATTGLGASSAGAAVTIGETFTPTANCSGPTTMIAPTSPPSPAAQYTAPSAGVITSWKIQLAATVPPVVELTVVRPAGGNNFVTIGRGGLEEPVANQVNSYATRIRVLAGDVLGYYTSAGLTCAGMSTGSAVAFFNGPRTAVDSTNPFSPVSGYRPPISAELEPDADNDGFGDETQDQCPSDADTVNACRDKAAPETTITKQPKKKVKKKKAVFRFASSEAGATFRCSLNGAAFSRCTSPASMKASLQERQGDPACEVAA
jgi:hypothetical protein